MNDSQQNNHGNQRSWFDRLSQVLLGEPKDREQLIEFLRNAQRRNLIDVDALGMIEGVLQVAEMQVRDIMVPRSQMVVVERDATIENMLPVIVESAHSRFPVIGESRDEVVGILLAKDLLSCIEGERLGRVNIRELLRPVVFIPESKRLNVLLKEFRVSRNHIAMVVDEYGGVAGLVTIEDVLEQIVGEIIDEHDVDEDFYIRKHSESEYTVKALTPIDEFNENFDTDFSDEEFDTIGGLLLNVFSHLPKRGESATIGKLRFKVLNADGRRIYLLHVSKVPRKRHSAAATTEEGGAP